MPWPFRTGWQLRNTALAIVVPVAAAAAWLTVLTIADLVAVRSDIAALRVSALRSVYGEQLGRHLQVMIKKSLDHIGGDAQARAGLESSRAGVAGALDRLEGFTEVGRRDNASPQLTIRTLRDWVDTEHQVERHLERAYGFARKGDRQEARRLVMDDLDVLVRVGLLAQLDPLIQHERTLLEDYRVRVKRGTEHWLLRPAGGLDLQTRLLPAVYEAILAERFARDAYAELRAYTHYVIDGHTAEELGLKLHGERVSRALGQLNRVRRRANGEAANANGSPDEIYARIRSGYAQILALHPAAKRSEGLAVLNALEGFFDETFLPHIDATVAADMERIEAEMAGLAGFSRNVGVLAIVLGSLVILLSVGSPYLTMRLLVRPVTDLVSTISRFREGYVEERPAITRSDELGSLERWYHDLMTELQTTSRKVRALAFYDSATGLPNRQLFEERLAGALVAARLQGRVMALISMDLDGLKQVNETLGHSAGDEMLRQVAGRIRESVRLGDIVARPNADVPDTELSRLGGNEFSILLTNVAEAQDASKVAERILSAFGKPFEIEGHELILTTSLGIGIYPLDGGDVETLLRNANAATHHAQIRGSNHYQFYSEAMNTTASRQLHIRSRLTGALERGDLSVHYQPIRDARTSRVIGSEALLRWTDPEMGPIPPSEFIPIAEESGQILPIGEWVLRAACTQARAWKDSGYRQTTIAVNVSAHQLRQKDWVETVTRTLEEAGLSADQLELELTETAIMQDDAATLAGLNELNEMGVRIVLDDFGTGYSSLSYLKRFPIGRLKIDRSFVSEIGENEDGSALTAAIIALAHSLDLDVVAEGVETIEQARFLQANNCDLLQGYLISRAVPADDFERFLEDEKGDSDANGEEV